MRTAGFSDNLYFFPPTSKSIWRLIASRRLIWPLIKLENVGALESFNKPSGLNAKKEISMIEHTFKIRHEGFSTTVQSVNNHLPIRWTCDFNTSILKARCGWCALPRRFYAYMSSLWWKIKRNARVESTLSIFTRDEQRLASGFKGTMESYKKFESSLCEELLLSLLRFFWINSDAGDHRFLKKVSWICSILYSLSRLSETDRRHIPSQKITCLELGVLYL